MPQLGGGLFLTDGGIETTLIFLEGLELPDFAAFHLLRRPEGVAALRKYFRTYAALAERFGAGLILESATWRASADWGATARLLGSIAWRSANRQAIRLLEEIRDERRTEFEAESSSAAASARAETDTSRRGRCPQTKRKRTTAGRSKRSRPPTPTW